VEHTEFRGGAGVGQYMAEDQPHLKFAVKEVLRDAHAPTHHSVRRLKRVGRCVKGSPRLVICFDWQLQQKTGVVKGDSNWAGCRTTRKSTTCVIVLMGKHSLKELSATQGVITLSSAEAELQAAVRAAIEALFLKHLCAFFEHEIDLELRTDASAALGIMNRLGCGKKMRHVEVQQLYIQHLIRQGTLRVLKEDGKKNEADLGTKHLPRAAIERILKALSMKLLLAGNLVSTADAGQVADYLGEKHESVQITGGYLNNIAVFVMYGDWEIFLAGMVTTVVLLYLARKLALDAKWLSEKLLELLTPRAQAIPHDQDLVPGCPALRNRLWATNRGMMHYRRECPQFRNTPGPVNICRTCIREEKERLRALENSE
jgi:hypothetical protein